MAAAGKHIYCEKPFALAKADAVAMLEACKRAGIVIGVGHHFRLMPSMRVLAELKEKGAFGTIMHVEGNYSHDWLANYPADSWRMQASESRAGGMTGMGIHVLDCFRDLAGPMKRIAALSKARALKLETGDTTSALIEFESGATGTLATTIKTPFDWRIAVYGENCHAMSVSETRAIVSYAGKEAGGHRPAGRQSSRPQSGLFRQGRARAGRVPDLARRHFADGVGAGGGVQVGRCGRGVDGGLVVIVREGGRSSHRKALSAQDLNRQRNSTLQKLISLGHLSSCRQNLVRRRDGRREFVGMPATK